MKLFWTRGLVAPVSVGEGKGTTVAIGSTTSASNTAQVAGPRVVNMLAVRAPSQVMLEVKVAEVSARRLYETLPIHPDLRVRDWRKRPSSGPCLAWCLCPM